MRINSRNHITEARFRGSSERIVGQNNEINAGNKRELLNRLTEIASMVSSGEIAGAEPEDEMSAQEKRAQVVAAYNDRETAAWAELGAAITGVIETRVEREGFMRSVLERQNLEQGNVPRIRVRTPNTTGVLTRGPAQSFPQFVRDKYITADEFTIWANPHVDLIELNQDSSDVVEDKYFEGLEQILVKEDKTVKDLMDTTVGIYNDITYFANLTPSILGSCKTAVETWRLPVSKFIFAIDILNDIAFGSDFANYFNPVTNYEIVMTGRIGTLFGMELLTDGYREPTLQVLDSGEFYLVTNPNLLGGYTDRGPVNSQPSDLTSQGIAARGWFMYEIMSAAVANAKGVVKGMRS